VGRKEVTNESGGKKTRMKKRKRGRAGRTRSKGSTGRTQKE
jgi:hypothetical protein